MCGVKQLMGYDGYDLWKALNQLAAQAPDYVDLGSSAYNSPTPNLPV